MNEGVQEGSQNMNVAPDRFGERMKVLVDSLGGTTVLAERTGLSASVIRKYLNGQSDPSRERLLAIARAAGVRLEWLASGEGPMYAAENTPTAITTYAENGDLSDDFVLIPLYDVEAAAGPGRFPDQEQVVNQLAFRRDWVRNVLGAAPDRLALISAVGDSMEPTIRHGDLLLIDLSVDHIRDDAIYVLEKFGQLIVKRIQRFISGRVKVRSDNPAYEEEVIEAGEADQLRIAGRVRWIARMT